MATQTLVVTSTNPVDFINRVIEAAQQGAVLKERTCPRLKGMPYAVELTLETDKGIDSKPGVNAIPVPESEKIYTKEELEALEWSDFKKACKGYNLTGRDRNLLTTRYLQATNQVV
jgi:hypothetical protein